MTPAIEILETGPLCTVQDLGRPGLAAIGVPRSGAFDRDALRLANRLVGNDEHAAGLEITLGGLAVRLRRACTIALTGAACDGLDPAVALTLAAGSVIRLGRPRSGLRSYLAVRGGLDVEPVLRSRSTDLLSGLGPPPLQAGALLAVGAAAHEMTGEASGAGSGEVSSAVGWPARAVGLARVDPGPRTAQFTGDVLARLTSVAWTVRPDSDRIGVRLDGPALRRLDDTELPSEPTIPGAVQVPPDGRPIVFGPDGPVTGGYPVIAVVRDLGVLAQLRPGQSVRFIA